MSAGPDGRVRWVRKRGRQAGSRDRNGKSSAASIPVRTRRHPAAFTNVRISVVPSGPGMNSAKSRPNTGSKV